VGHVTDGERSWDFAINIRTKGYHANCLIVSPSMAAPYELEKEITVIDFPMPSREEISARS
jgi:hypothetical protein